MPGALAGSVCLPFAETAKFARVFFADVLGALRRLASVSTGSLQPLHRSVMLPRPCSNIIPLFAGDLNVIFLRGNSDLAYESAFFKQQAGNLVFNQVLDDAVHVPCAVFRVHLRGNMLCDG